MRQLFVESLVLALLGAAAGCLFAWGGLKTLMTALPASTFPDEANVTLNPRVLGATVAIAIVTAILFGMAPAIGAFSRNLSDPLKAGGRGNSGFRRGRMRNVLIVCEVALSLVLLTGAGLMMRSFFIARYAELGIAPEHLIVSQIPLGKGYSTVDQQARFAHDVVAHLDTVPGVVSATAALDFPPFGGIDTEFEVPGKTHSEKWKGQMGFVDAQFLRTLGLRLLRGRALTEQDVQGKRKVTLINETLAKKYFVGEDPIGRQIELVGLKTAPVPVANPTFEIVGVVSDLKNNGTRQGVAPQTYAPLTTTGFGVYMVYARAAGNPAALAKSMEGEILRVDKNVIPQRTMAMEQALNDFEYAQPRFGLQLFSVFASIGLILVTVGVYSVVSYTVTQQHREIGIRMALGATSGNVLRLMMMAGMRFILIGVAVGLVAAFLLMRLIKSQLFGVATYDPITLAAVMVLLSAVGMGACYLPSLRATRVDPTISLRYE